MKVNKLIVWQKAMDLTAEVSTETRHFPKEEIYGLISQLRRAAVSVPSNTPEGQGRKSTSEFLDHLSIAYGSLMEVETRLPTASRLSYLDAQQLEQLIERTGKWGLLNGLMRSLATGHWSLNYPVAQGFGYRLRL